MSLITGLLLSGILFIIGLIGVLIRRNIIFMLLSIEIMLNASGMAFIFAGSRWANPEGQIMFLFILAIAASEVAIGLALVIMIYKNFNSLDINNLSLLKD